MDNEDTEIDYNITGQELKDIHEDYISLFERFMKVTAKDQNHEVGDVWNVISPNLMKFCDEFEKSRVRKEVFDNVMASLDDKTKKHGTTKASEVLEKYEHDVQAGYEKLDLGEKTAGYNRVKSAMTTALSEQRKENDIIPVLENCKYVDPFTKLRLKDPVKNLKCGHVYERTKIFELISEKSTRCPIPGCIVESQILPSDLVSDVSLKKFLSQK